MSREIKFRGKRIGNGEWITGYYGILGKETDIERHVIMVSTLQTCSIIDRFYFTDYEVTPESVGCYIGLKDKNGVDICEGDIVNVKGRKRIKNYVTEIIWFNNGFCLKENKTYFNDYKLLSGALEIIGNIHENPELLNHD